MKKFCTHCRHPQKEKSEIHVLVVLALGLLIVSAVAKLGISKFEQNQLRASVANTYYMSRRSDDTIDMIHFTGNGAVQEIRTKLVYNYIGGENGTSRDWVSQRIDEMDGHKGRIQDQIDGTGHDTILANIVVLHDDAGSWTKIHPGMTTDYTVTNPDTQGTVVFYATDTAGNLSSVGKPLNVDSPSDSRVMVEPKGKVTTDDQIGTFKRIDKDEKVAIKYRGDNEDLETSDTSDVTPKYIAVSELFDLVRFNHQ